MPRITWNRLDENGTVLNSVDVIQTVPYFMDRISSLPMDTTSALTTFTVFFLTDTTVSILKVSISELGPGIHFFECISNNSWIGGRYPDSRKATATIQVHSSKLIKLNSNFHTYHYYHNDSI